VSPELQQRVRKIYEEALEKPEGQRLAFLKAACPNDLETYQGVVEMLGSLATAPAFLSAQPRPMERIGRYVISGELGRGAMGVVYEATDPLIGRTVAVKIIHLQLRPDSKEAEFLRDRLFREARAAGRLFHPNIVVILDVGHEGDIAFIAMERVDGTTLERTMAAQKRLKVADSLEILRQTAAALDYAHQNGVIHRDIKPANIMLHKGTTVKVADFGIAKSLSTEHGTVAGMIMGTPSYMSPEQIEAHPVSGQSDQFALAVVAFELLSGNRPFKGDSLATLAHMIVYGERPSIRSIEPSLPAGLDEVLQRALAKKPEQRYESCSQFVAAVEGQLNSVSAAEPADKFVDTLVAAPVLPLPDVVGADVPQSAKKRRPKLLWILAGAGAALIMIDLALFYFRAAPTHRAIVVSQPQSSEQRVPDQPAAVAKGTLFAKKPAGRAPSAPPALELPSSKSLSRTAISQPSSAPAASPFARTPAISHAIKQTVGEQLYTTAAENLRTGQTQAALALFRQAADLGDSRAMQDLGEIYMEGSVVPKDDQEAAKWFRKGADKGNTSAMLFLGGMYRLGNGVEQSDKDAADWFRKAADAGNPAAMYDLAILYEDGRGVPRDGALAKQLYQKAAQLGDQEAQKRLNELR
jgi:serine/threonine protein kinase